MLDRPVGAVQHHHSGVFPSLKRALRNQFPRQNVIVIPYLCAHRSFEFYSKCKPSACRTAHAMFVAATVFSQTSAIESSICEMSCKKASAARRCRRDDNRL